MSKFAATHVVSWGLCRAEVMLLESGEAPTRDEWQRGAEASLTRTRTGGWLLNGEELDCVWRVVDRDENAPSAST